MTTQFFHLSEQELKDMIESAQQELAARQESTLRDRLISKEQALVDAIDSMIQLRNTTLQEVNRKLAEVANIANAAIEYGRYIAEHTNTNFTIAMNGETFTSTGYDFSMDSSWNGSSC